jgi:hypothetical protein
MTSTARAVLKRMPKANLMRDATVIGHIHRAVVDAEGGALCIRDKLEAGIRHR